MKFENVSTYHSDRRFGFRFLRSRALGVGVVAGWISVIVVLLGSADLSIPGDRFAAKGEAWFLIGHLLLFSVLGMLTVLAALTGGWTRRLSVALTAGLLLGIAMGVLTEVYQLGVIGRSGNLEDVAADFVGAAIGASLGCVAYARIMRRPDPSHSS